jgi:hypothetical protein
MREPLGSLKWNGGSMREPLGSLFRFPPIGGIPLNDKSFFAIFANPILLHFYAFCTVFSGLICTV